MTAKKAVLPLYDFQDTDEVFVDELATVEMNGAVAYLMFAVRRMTDGKPARHLRLRVVIPSDKRSEMGRRLLAGGSNALSPAAADEDTLFH